MYNDVLNKIQKIKESYPDPQCYFTAIVLASEFGGTIWYNSGQCLAQIGESFFDKRGLVDPKEFEDGNYVPLSEFGWNIEKTLIEAMVESWN